MLERTPSEVGPLLWDAFRGLWENLDVEPLSLEVHRWRYSVASGSPGESCLVDEAMSLVLCGDWCIGARVEGAWLSGRAAADSLVQHSGGGPRV